MRLRSHVFAQLIGIGQDILCTQLGALTGTITAQLGDATAGVPDIDEAQWTQTPGVWSLPASPTPDAPVNGGIAAQAVTIKCGNRDVVIGVRDVRTNAVYGNLKPGDTCVGASNGPSGGVQDAPRTLYKAAQGAAVVMAKDANGRDVQCYVGRDKIQLSNAFGAITIDENGVSITAGQAALKLTPAGAASLIGQTASVVGSAVSVAGAVATAIGTNPGSKTFIGAAATPTTPAAYVNPAAPTVPTPSTAVFLSPV